MHQLELSTSLGWIAQAQSRPKKIGSISSFLRNTLVYAYKPQVYKAGGIVFGHVTALLCAVGPTMKKEHIIKFTL